MAISFNQTLSQGTPTIDAGVSHELAIWRAANYSNVRYKLNITLEKNAPMMKGDIEIRVNLSEEAAKNPLILDWRTTQFENDKDKPYANVVAVNDAMNIRSQINNEHLLIPNGLLKTGENAIKIEFTSPIKTSGAAITRYVDKEDGAEYIYSLFVPSDASTAFPVFDQPDLKARFQLEVTSKTFERVVSNAIGKTSDYNTNTDRFTFAETEPISTYVFAFAAGDFVSIQENPPKDAAGNSIKALEMEGTVNNFRVFVRRSQAEKFKQHSIEVFRLNREGVKFLENYFDYKFPFPKYDLVLIPEFPFGGMEHAGVTFLREDRVIFPQEPTANDYITRGNLIFHEAAHQWFGDTVTMKWFDDLWLKEGFAEFMAYKTMEKVLPQYNAWKAFYERNKPLAYLTDSTKGTTPIYQEIPNLSSAKSAYGNIVYRKAPAFLKQAEFYLGEKEFQTSVRAFLKKNQFANAEWTNLVKEFETSGKYYLKDWANVWVTQRGLSKMRVVSGISHSSIGQDGTHYSLQQSNDFNTNVRWEQKVKLLIITENNERIKHDFTFGGVNVGGVGKGILEKTFLSINANKPKTSPPYKQLAPEIDMLTGHDKPIFIFPNHQDYGYGIFLLDKQSRDYVLANIQNERDDFLRSMMWGALWDSVREAEHDPKDYVELAIKNISGEKDELTVQTILGRVSTAMSYYLSEKQQTEIAPRLEKVLLERINGAETLGLRITFYRAFLNVASTEESKQTLKEILTGKFEIKDLKLKTKDKFDILTKLLILNDTDAPKLLANLAKTETSDEAKRYFYAARAGIGTMENKREFWSDFINNKELSESYIESAFVPYNSVRHADLTLPFLEKALTELPNLKSNRKIFFVNGWLAAFIGGQRDEKALAIVNKFLADNQNLDKDLRLKILEAADSLDRSINIRQRFKG